jgi:hypothetical protein
MGNIQNTPFTQADVEDSVLKAQTLISNGIWHGQVKDLKFIPIEMMMVTLGDRCYVRHNSFFGKVTLPLCS